MKMRKIFAGMTAIALAAACFSMTASATKLSDVVYPSETDSEKNDAWYSICAIGFYMNGGWTGWNQYDDIGNIDENGILEASFDISEGLTFGATDADGNNHDNTLGMMGFMICNLPNDSYPYDVEILEADFTPKDGSTIELDSIKSITELDVFPEKKDSDVKDARIVVRPTPDDTNDVAACSEIEGTDQAGNFKGGTLHIKIDFGAPPAPEADSSSEEEKKADESKADESKADGTTGGGSSTTTTSSTTDSGTATDSSSTADTVDAGTTDTAAAADTTSSETESKAENTDVKSAESKTDSSSKTEAASTTATGTTTTTKAASTTTTTTGASADSKASAAAENNSTASDATQSADTGIGETLGFGFTALALAGIVVTKRRDYND